MKQFLQQTLNLPLTTAAQSKSKSGKTTNSKLSQNQTQNISLKQAKAAPVKARDRGQRAFSQFDFDVPAVREAASLSSA